MNFKKARENMINEQIMKRGIKDERVLKAIADIPRENFVLKQNEKDAYIDCPLPIGMGQTISQPYMVALMTQCLSLDGSEYILEIGTGSGYQTAILSKLTTRVYTVERFKVLSDRARAKFNDMGLKNIETIVGDGSQGLEKYSPYDAIIVTAGAQQIPKKLIEQLKENGKIIIPVGSSYFQELLLGKKIENKLKIKNYGGCVFVPLVGRYS
ncbi:MAG: protein-L-isoaspartate(D-aspartate) O-methyltransferase [Candidatus Caldatribacteriota bacterium]|nr:protein-L-isoaspartate(D-aspartate) O-methyltransferase [Candidatus Caldatribacteriota bacterium]